MSASILVVDDSLTVRMHLAGVLGAAGFEVTSCATATEARVALEGTVDLLVLDVLLPDADGLEFLRELRSTRDRASLPTVILSSATDVDDRLRELALRAEAHFEKPCDPDELVACVRALVHARERQRSAETATAPPAPTVRAVVLAVDDSPTALEILEIRLRRTGFDVIPASCGEEALAILGRRAVDGVLVDYLMPGISGPETCAAIRRDPAFRDLPVVVLSGFEDPEAFAAAIEAGADDYIVKSLDFDIPAIRLRQLIRRRQREAERVEEACAPLRAELARKDEEIARLRSRLRTDETAG